MPTLNPSRRELLSLFALDVEITSGLGTMLRDAEGREILDFLSQYGALPFGHNPPEIWAEINKAQIEETPLMIQPMRSPHAERLADRLAEITPGDLSIVTLANSGAETAEAAIKLARIRTGRRIILSTQNGFHGKTMGALSATGKSLYQDGFAVATEDYCYIPYGDVEALRGVLEAAHDRIAAFIVEPIQGEGGVVCPPKGYIDTAIALCREYGVLSVLDEIQTGLGRTGALFACSDGEEVPDMLLLAKALGGGMMPIGACIARPSAWDDRFGRRHSSTFAGNGLACRAALATLDHLLNPEMDLIGNVADNGAHFRNGLEDLQRRFPSVIREVRGRGYMMGLEFQKFDTSSHSAVLGFASLNGGITALISSYLLNQHQLLTAPLFNETSVIRLQPSLIVGRAEIDRALVALEDLCEVLASADAYRLVRHLVQKPVEQIATSASEADLPPVVGNPVTQQAGTFSFLIHYTEIEDIFRSDPTFRSFTPEELENWCDWVKKLGPGFVRHVAEVRSKTGATARGTIISVPLLPNEMRGQGRKMAGQMIKTAVETAAAEGTSRVGLGAFTSIASRGGELVTGLGTPITSGNTLTTVSAVKAIERMAACTGIPLDEAHVVIVGASGAIGRLASLMLARKAGSMTLVGNAANPFSPALLARVADELCETICKDHSPMAGDLARDLRSFAAQQKSESLKERNSLPERLQTYWRGRGMEPLLDWTTPLDVALETADIVLVATSAEMALMDPANMTPGTLVCDVARPPNVANSEAGRDNVLVFDGGLVAPPFDIHLGPFQTLPENLCWGCLGETVLLTLAGETRDFSIGSKLSLEDADHIARLAEEHGFEPAPAQWYGQHLKTRHIGKFAKEVDTRWSRRAEHIAEKASQRALS